MKFQKGDVVNLKCYYWWVIYFVSDTEFVEHRELEDEDIGTPIHSIKDIKPNEKTVLLYRPYPSRRKKDWMDDLKEVL